MQFITPVLLCKKTYDIETNDIGEASESMTERTVYVSEESAKRSEFYQANANGYKVEKVLTIRAFEYKNEEIIKINNEIFTVLRSFDLKNGNIELTLIRGVNNVSS